MAATVQSILQAAYPEYARTHRVAGRGRRALGRILRCGTGELGVFVRRCPAGHFAEARGCSCRHRSCPSCASRRRMLWLQGWKRRLLPCLHLHTILTLPSELHPLWRHNRRAMAKMLFAVARQTLFGLLAEPEHLGAVPGVLMALHTWSRSLSVHPHLHCLVTGGGYSAEGHWRPLRREFLVPVARLRRRFRKLFLDALEGAWREGSVGLPPGWQNSDMSRQLCRLRRIKWNVRIEPPYKHGHGLVSYLARYLRGGPVGNRRIGSFDGKRVEIVVGREGKDPATCVLSAEEFVGRWLEHIPDSGLHTVRAYGLYASAMREKREACRAEMVPAQEELYSATDVDRDPTRCPVCDRELIYEEHRFSDRRRRRWASARAQAPPQRRAA